MAYRQFSKIIKTSIGSREFNFLQRVNQQGFYYNTDVADERGDRLQFDMRLQDGEWKIAGALIPEWINKSEKDLHQVITEEQATEPQKM